MRYRVNRVSVHQSSKVLALVYGGLGILYIPFMYLINFASPGAEPIPGVLIWLLPAFFAVLCYIMMALLFAIYNAVSEWVGGVELDLTSTRNESTGEFKGAA